MSPSDIDIKVGAYVGQIGRIDSAFLGVEDHGIFTVNLGFDFGGSHQGIGHLCLGSPSRDEWTSVRFLYQLTEAVGPLTSCVGNRVVVLREDSGWNAPIVGVMPLMGGKPLIFKEALAERGIE